MNAGSGLLFEPLTSLALIRVRLPMGYLHTSGPAADSITRLGWGLGIISLLVVLIIALLLLGGIFRRRQSGSAIDPRSLTVRSDTGGMAWIYIGVGVTAVILVGCMVWTLVVSADVTHPAVTPELTVEITASQWWWAARYDSQKASEIFSTANEIHIPVGQPVRFELTSADVIHSFWIPQLAGKMDVIPGQTNAMWMQADHAGEYRGQCAAFCGGQHAHMALMVVAESPQDFSAWKTQQLLENSAPVEQDAFAGSRIFQTHCAVCHTIRGVSPSGLVGPDLSHLMTRRSIVAGMFPNTPENLADWIAHSQVLKPGSRMPSQVLSETELTDIVAYLKTLK